MLNGIDVSNNNSIAQVKEELDKGCDFVMIKATEGVTFQDGKALGIAGMCYDRRIPMFFYHFCRFRQGGYKEESENFLSHVNKILSSLDHTLKVGLALDFEVEVEKTRELARMAEYIHTRTGAAPLIYCSQWLVPEIGRLLDTEKYGLWVAKYSKKIPNITPWNIMAFWQYTNNPIDRNRFYGTMTQLMEYQDYMVSRRCPHCTAEKCVKECK